jgi:DNA-binding MarR family transcriptional regulator
MINVDSIVQIGRILLDMRSNSRAALSDAIIAQFRATLREIRCMSGDRMRRADISFTHFHIVSMLERHGEMPMSRLADMLDISLSNASGVIDRLEERGFVERLRVPDDRRVVHVRTTDAGRTLLLQADVLKEEMIQAVLDRLDTSQLERTAAALQDLAVAAADVFAADPQLHRHDHAHDAPASDPIHPTAAAATPA